MTLRNFRLFSRSLVLGTSFALSGCGQPQLPTAPLHVQPATESLGALHRLSQAAFSWMAPDAASQDLLYVTDYDYVTVYSYPAGKPKGKLTGFHSAVGDCVDKSGNVFFTNQLPAVIYEYAHGGTKRIATLKVDKDDVLPVGCAIDPLTGNLAVTGFSHGADIFRGARGKPAFYRDKKFYDMEFCAYDDDGNLFVNGNVTMKRSALVELSRGATKFADIALSTPTSGDAGLQWTGKRLAVGGYFPVKSAHPVIYRYLISGQQGKETGMTPLGAPAYQVFQFLIDGSTVTVPNWAETGNRLYSVLLYSYPKGGVPLRQIMKHIANPRGVVVSHSQTSL